MLSALSYFEMQVLIQQAGGAPPVCLLDRGEKN